MPTVATQTTVQDRRRSTGVSSYGLEHAQHARSSAPPPANARYGALPMDKTNEEEIEDEEETSQESSLSTSSSDDSSFTKFSDLTGKQWAAVGMLAIANLCSTIAFSCIAPFYPGEAQLKGLTTSEIGVIFGAFELVMFITAPLLGKYVSH